MKSVRSLFSLSLVALVATLAGCATDVAEQGVGSTEQAAVAEPEVASVDSVGTQAEASSDRGRPHGKRRGGPGGGASLIRAALHEDIGLTDAQKQTLQALSPKRAERNEAEARQAPQRDTTRSSTLAAAIRSGNLGTLDAAKKLELTGAMKAKLEARRANEVKALETLHDTLSPEQRIALVAAMQKHGARGSKDGPVRPEHGKGERGFGGPMMGMLKDLDLTEAQKEQIRAKMQASAPSEADRAAFAAKAKTFAAERQNELQSFIGDEFDASAFVTRAQRPAAEAAKREGARPNPLAAVVSVLSEAQREQLAKKIEAGPQARQGTKQ